MNEDLDPREEIRAAVVLRDLMTMRGRRCPDCGGPICGHEALMSLAMGFKDAPRCCSCLAIALDRGKEELRDHLLAYIAHRPCHHAGWIWASREEGFAAAALPGCLWPDASAVPAQHRSSGVMEGATRMDHADKDFELKFDDEWDAGDMGCGDLVLHLRLRLKDMQPRQVLKLTARDPGAREDLPAWCRMTGNVLVASNHPIYWIQRKEQ